MDEQSSHKADDLVTLTPDLVDKLKRTIGYLRGGVDALRTLCRRPYLLAEQALQIREEADELEREDVTPLRAALRDGALSTTLRATVERRGRADY